MAKAANVPEKVPDDLITPQELAALLALSPQTLEGWRVARKGPRYYRINGRTVRYRRRESLTWATSDRVAVGETR